MAGMTDDVTLSDTFSEQGGDGGDPFGGGSHLIEWPRAVTVGQFQDEVAQACGDDVRIAVTVPTNEDGTDHTVSGQHPLKVYVSASADLSSVRKVLAAHRPDPYYGMSDDDVRRAQLEEKIRSDEDLTLREINQALQMMLR